MIPEEVKKEAERIKKEIDKILKDPDFIEACEKFNLKIHTLTPEELLRTFTI